MLAHPTLEVESPSAPTPTAVTWKDVAEGDIIAGRDGNDWLVTDITNWRVAGLTITAVNNDGVDYTTVVDPSEVIFRAVQP